jgi:hypothetical protein
MGGVVGGIFGGGKSGGSMPMQNPLTQYNLSTPAYDIKTDINGTSLSGSLVRQNTPFQQAYDTSFSRIMGTDLPQLRGMVAPNMSLFRTAAMGQLRNQQRKSRSDLVQAANLRGVRGTSFHRDDLNRLDAEFAQKRAETEAQVAAQELALTSGLLDAEMAMNTNAIAREFQEAGLTQSQANSLAQLNVQAQSANQQAMAAQMQADAQRSAGKGSMLGSIFGAGLGAFGKGGAFAPGGSFGGTSGGGTPIVDEILGPSGSSIWGSTAKPTSFGSTAGGAAGYAVGGPFGGFIGSTLGDLIF